MAGPVHSKQALAAFMDGEEHLVYARIKEAPPEAPLFRLDNETARDPLLRSLVKEHVECLMPECPDRRLKVVNRSENSGKRDGFSHYPGAGKHSPEGLFHQQGKALIQAWVTDYYPNIRVDVEAATSTARQRIADVLLTWPTGERVAVEIQYAALTVDHWRQRTDSYRAQGVTPAWLFGHHGHHLKPARGDDDLVQFSALHRAMTEAGELVLWVNPIEQSIGTPWTTASTSTSGTFDVTPRADTGAVRMDIAPLVECRLDAVIGILTPTHEPLVGAESAYKHALQAEAAAAAEAAREAAAQAAAHAARHEATWLSSELRQFLTDHFDGPIPEALANDTEHQDAVDANPVHWRSALYRDLIHERRRGTSLTVAECTSVLHRHGFLTEDEEGTHLAVRAFLESLARRRVIRIDRYGARRNKVAITIEREIIGPRQRREQAAAHAAAERRTAEMAARRARQFAATEEEHSKANATLAQRQAEGPWTHCRCCGSRLDPIWQNSGYHGVCRPEPLAPPPAPEPEDPQGALFSL